MQERILPPRCRSGLGDGRAAGTVVLVGNAGKEMWAAFRRDVPDLGGKDPQPKHMNDYVDLPDTRMGDNGGVHVNSGIPNHAFFLVATKIGGNAWEAPGHIWYKTLQQLHEQSQFQDCADISAQVAAADYGTNSTEHRAVLDAWAQVGLSVSGAVAETRRRGGKSRLPEGDGVFKRQLERLGAELKKTIEALSVS